MDVVVNNSVPQGNADLVLEKPTARDGAAVKRLVAECPPLDENSTYCNLLQCSHFAGTSCIARMDGEVLGFISGYLLPERRNTLFIWQVAIAKNARKRGLARAMLRAILARPACEHITFLETTITRANSASRQLFSTLADSLDASCVESRCFTRKQHFADQHDDEYLFRIGPFTPVPLQAGMVHPYISAHP